MTDEELKEIFLAARNAWNTSHSGEINALYWESLQAGLRAVAEHAAKLEREACAEAVDRISPSVEMVRIWENGFTAALNKAAERIRARGEEAGE